MWITSEDSFNVKSLSFIISLEEVISAIFDRSFLKFRTLMVALLNVGVAFFQRLSQVYPHWVVLPLGYEISKKLWSKIQTVLIERSIVIEVINNDR